VREWLSSQAAGGYVEYDASKDSFPLPFQRLRLPRPVDRNSAQAGVADRVGFEEVGLCLGALSGEARMREVVRRGGFNQFRRATETPFNLIYEARV
jgi:hypothetical protein